MYLSDLGPFFKQWGFAEYRSFVLRCHPDVTVEEATDGAVCFTTGLGLRARMHIPEPAARQLALRLSEGIRTVAVQEEYSRLGEQARAAFTEVLQALCERRMIVVAWQPSEDILAAFETPLPGVPDVPRTVLKPDSLVRLSRFSLIHRAEASVVLDLPASGLRLSFCDATIAAFVLSLDGCPSVAAAGTQLPGKLSPEAMKDFLSALVGARILETDEDDKAVPAGDAGLRPWEIHDLYFYSQSHGGYNFSALGALPDAAMTGAPPPLRDEDSVRPAIPLPIPENSRAGGRPDLSWQETLAARRSVREYDQENPPTLNELSAFLQCAARITGAGVATYHTPAGEQRIEVAFSTSPTAGGCQELRLFLWVGHCTGLHPAVYRYDAHDHTFVEVATAAEGAWMAEDAARSMAVSQKPPIVIALAARFNRANWKYRGIAFANVLRDVGAIYQTFYVAATGLGLGGCALGNVDARKFELMTGQSRHVEGAVGMFALGRPGIAGIDSRFE